MHRLSLVVASGDYSPVAVCGHLIAVASFVEKHGRVGSEAAAHGLSCSATCGILLD